MRSGVRSTTVPRSHHAPLAQLAEHPALNRQVRGSSPWRRTHEDRSLGAGPRRFRLASQRRNVASRGSPHPHDEASRLMATSWMTWSSGGVDRSIGRVDSGTSSTTSTASCSRPAPVPGRSLGQSPGDDHTSPVRPQPEPLPGRSLGQSPGDDHTPTIRRPHAAVPCGRMGQRATHVVAGLETLPLRCRVVPGLRAEGIDGYRE